jgi:histo-blood group ABO system transferase
MFAFTNMPLQERKNLKVIHQDHMAWPGPTLKRYHIFLNNSHHYPNQDYLFYCDADMRFVDEVGSEVLGDLVATNHPGFYNKRRREFSYEKRSQSRAYIPMNEGTRYFAGGFNGGKRDRYLEMAQAVKEMVDADAANGIIAEWHDESYMNRYLASNPPTVILDPSYCYPESWDLPFKRRLLALDKNHSEMRS